MWRLCLGFPKIASGRRGRRRPVSWSASNKSWNVYTVFTRRVEKLSRELDISEAPTLGGMSMSAYIVIGLFPPRSWWHKGCACWGDTGNVEPRKDTSEGFLRSVASLINNAICQYFFSFCISFICLPQRHLWNEKEYNPRIDRNPCSARHFSPSTLVVCVHAVSEILLWKWKVHDALGSLFLLYRLHGRRLLSSNLSAWSGMERYCDGQGCSPPWRRMLQQRKL